MLDCLAVEILPKDILSSKESRDLIIECCVGEPLSDGRAIAVSQELIRLATRIHPHDINRGKRDMRERSQEDHLA
jgi:hypothetical protein